VGHQLEHAPLSHPDCSRAPGRPRCPETAQTILRVTLQILRAQGLTSFSIEGVAQAAGVGKATVYRWWPSRGALAVDAFCAGVAPQLAFPDTGSLRGDFLAQMHKVVAEMNGPDGKVLASILAVAQMDEEVAEAFRTRWLQRRRAEGREALGRAMARGELATDLDPEFFFDLLYSPLYLRLMVRHQPLTQEFAERVLDVCLPGLAPRATPEGSEG
jgi:AcrR family transcriptional regulator